MRKLYPAALVLLLIAAAEAVIVPGRAAAQSTAQSVAVKQESRTAFDARDLSGVWWVDAPGPEAIFARAKNGGADKCQTCHPSEQTVAEPPLTPWAKQHLASPKRGACDPIAVPAQFWYTQLYPFEFVVTPGRIFQFFEKQNEWRTIWMNRGHLETVSPTYMGDAVGNWDGDTLVVDTIGFNGKDMIEPVGLDHTMSDGFHLVERWRRVSAGKLDLDVTYYDPKAWGDKSWGGLKKEFLLQPNMQLMEIYCTAEDNARFDEFLKPLSAPHPAMPNGKTPSRK